MGIDLGGGSLELVVGDRFEILFCRVPPLGATRLKGELGVGELLDARGPKRGPRTGS